MTSLTRITTVYVALEDRIRLSGERENAAPLVIWLTRRLLDRLLPVLLQWLEREGGDLPRTDTLQSFAQQAARAKFTPQPPVHVDADVETWLVQSIDVNSTERVIRLTFKTVDGQSASLTFAAQPLRQWLNILHDAWLKAEWSQAVWPGWVREDAPLIQQTVMVH